MTTAQRLKIIAGAILLFLAGDEDWLGPDGRPVFLSMAISLALGGETKQAAKQAARDYLPVFKSGLDS